MSCSTCEALRRENEGLKAQIQVLLKESRTDALTGLNNQGDFWQTLPRIIAHAHRYQETLSLVIFDIDRFKGVNDTFGHHVGDQVIKKLADIIRAHTRASDYVARVGGEEFVILLSNATSKDARSMIEAFCKKIEAELRVEVNSEKTVRCTASFGVCEFCGQDPETLYKTADAALYRAKEGGRNQVCVA